LKAFDNQCTQSSASPYCQKVLEDHERVFADLERTDVRRLDLDERMSYLRALLIPFDNKHRRVDARTMRAVEELYASAPDELYVDEAAWRQSLQNIPVHASKIRKATRRFRSSKIYDLARELMISLEVAPIPIEFGSRKPGEETLNAFYCPENLEQCGGKSKIVLIELSRSEQDATAVVFEEVYHYYQDKMRDRLCNGQISEGDPFFRQANLYSMNSVYQPGSNNERAYLRSPIEAYAKKFSSLLAQKTLAPCTADEIAGTYDSGYGPIACTANGTSLSCRYGENLSKLLELELQRDGSLRGTWDWKPGNRENRERGSAQFEVTGFCELGNGFWGYGSRPTNSWSVGKN